MSLAWGLVLLAAPEAGAIAMTWWLGAYALAFGGAMVALGWRLRNERRRTLDEARGHWAWAGLDLNSEAAAHPAWRVPQALPQHLQVLHSADWSRASNKNEHLNEAVDAMAATRIGKPVERRGTRP